MYLNFFTVLLFKNMLCICTWLNDILFLQPVLSNHYSFTQFTLQLRHDCAVFFSVDVSSKDCYRLLNCVLYHNPFLHYNDCLKSALKCVIYKEIVNYMFVIL